MHSFHYLANRIEQSSLSLIGRGPICDQINELCVQFRTQCESIVNSRGTDLPSLAIVGAKGQGKTWVARQFIKNASVAALLPSGVLSNEATTKMYWIGPHVPEGLDNQKEIYIPCQSESMIPLRQPYMLLDTPGITDDDRDAARIAKEAMSLSPVKLLVVRRDQLRGAILGSLALFTEGAICIPVVNCVPRLEVNEWNTESDCVPTESLAKDLETFKSSLQRLAPETRFLPPILVEDWEATGDEGRASRRLQSLIYSRLASESLESLAATRTNRLAAAEQRLKTKVAAVLHSQIPTLAQAMRRLQSEAESVPGQALEAVLGSPTILQAAIRSRMRAHFVTETGLIWFPYRTVVSVLGVTSGAWDRLLLSFAGSVPSIFGTFLAWAKNMRATSDANRELNEGIRQRIEQQLHDRLEPVQAAFYRSVSRIGGDRGLAKDHPEPSRLRLTGIEELQTQARTTFEWCVDRAQPSRWNLQLAGLVGCIIFWGMLLGPVLAVYKHYLLASVEAVTLKSDNSSLESFHLNPSLLFASLLLSLFPLLIYSMIVFSIFQRSAKVKRIAQHVVAEEHKLLESLKQSGVIRLYFDDPILDHAEFLVGLTSHDA
ncbi:MAG: hypothetical protein MUC43_13065 [Pirellula sp.]|nr:hypothetical protein [Pirellula sp.]